MIISKTPLRMSFAGGGSDLQSYYSNGYGAVLSTSIDKYVYVMVNRKFDDYIRVGYSQTEYVNNINEIGHNIIRETLRKVDLTTTGIDIVYMSDVLPRKWGTGLGFSSSLTVGLLKALYCLKGEEVTPTRLAAEACEIEIDILDSPIGKQDQYAAAFGGLNYIKFKSDETVLINPLNLNENEISFLNKKLLLFYTGLSSESSPVLKEQRHNTETKESTRKNIGKMVELANNLKVDFDSGIVDTLGKRLNEGWNIKKGLASKITNDSIDKYYSLAMNLGAEGGKILGSGGGGFILLYSDEAHHPKIRKGLSDLKELNFCISSSGSEIIYNK